MLLPGSAAPAGSLWGRRFLLVLSLLLNENDLRPAGYPLAVTSVTDNELLREKIRQSLAVGAKANQDSASIARSTVRTWRQVISRLTPVIGRRGVEVLFDRSLHLTSTVFPWLAGAGEAGVSPLETLRSRLE